MDLTWQLLNLPERPKITAELRVSPSGRMLAQQPELTVTENPLRPGCWIVDLHWLSTAGLPRESYLTVALSGHVFAAGPVLSNFQTAAGPVSGMLNTVRFIHVSS